MTTTRPVRVFDATNVEPLMWPTACVDSDQAGATATALPKASAPVAASSTVPPTYTDAVGGTTASAASGAAVTVSVCVTAACPARAAETVAEPASRSE